MVSFSEELLRDPAFIATILILLVYAWGLKGLAENILKRITVSERYLVLSKKETFLITLAFAFSSIYVGLVLIGIYEAISSLVKPTGILRYVSLGFFGLGAILIVAGAKWGKELQELF
ncbi:MAG: hypothetical protein V1820_02010 [archaeon]